MSRKILVAFRRPVPYRWGTTSEPDPMPTETVTLHIYLSGRTATGAPVTYCNLASDKGHDRLSRDLCVRQSGGAPVYKVVVEVPADVFDVPEAVVIEAAAVEPA